MKLYFYCGVCFNFGDELNWWMWLKIFGDVFDDSDEKFFFGIGLILFLSYFVNINKVVFGFGYGGYMELFKIDDKWDVRFLCGKYIVRVLGLNESLGIGDLVILLWLVVDYVRLS